MKVILVALAATLLFPGLASASTTYGWVPAVAPAPAVDRYKGFDKEQLLDGHVGKAKRELLAQQRLSADVISYFTSGPSKWKIATRHKRCSGVDWPRLCAASREELSKHRWLYRLASDKFDRLYGFGLARDWLRAVLYVQRYFPGTQSWLLNCSTSEGGHGPWVPNKDNSGAGGWMQYMSGTFSSDYHSAVRYLAARGVRVPAWTNSWYSPLGQALAAGWARYTGHTPPGKWTGALC